MKMTIGRKIAFPFFVMFILIVGVAGITYQGFNKVSASLDNMQLETVKRGSAGNLRFNITQLLMASNDYVITQNRYYQREFDRLNLVVDNYYYEFIRLSLTDEEQLLIEHIKQDLVSIRAYSAQIFSISNPRLSPKAWALMETMDYRFGEEVNKKTTQIFDGISKRIKEYMQQAAAVKENATNLIFGVTFLSIFISLVVAFLTVRRISKPIVTVAKAADSIAKGDYSHRVVVKTHDEVALLAKSFNVMAESIQKSQKALKESKRLTEAIVGTVPIGLLVFDAKGKILTVNNSFCDIFGLNSNVLVGQNIEPMFEKLKTSEECRNHILTRNPVSDIECSYSDPVKGLRIMSLTLNPIQVSNTESLLIIEDITKRKHDEQIVINSEKHFRALIENSTDGLCVISPDGHLLYESPSNNSIIGYEHNELLNKNILTLFHSDDLPAINDLLMSLLEQPLTTVSAELRFLHKDGRWLWIEAKWKNAFNEPAIGGIVVNCRDITERKRAEEELLKIGTAVEQTADCVVITDKNGIIQYVNTAFTKIFGYTKEEALGKTPRILKSGLHPPEFYETLWETILFGEVFTATFINKRKDGELIYEVKTITPIKDKEGHITHFVSTAKEITEQRRAEEAMRKKEEHHKAVIESIFKFIPEGVLVLTESLNLLKQNKAFDDIVQKYAALLGYTEQELAEMIIHQLRSKIVIGDSKEIYIWKKDQLETDPSGRDELIFQFNTARMFLAEEEEEEASIVVSLLDITDRKRAEEELRASEAKFRKLISSLPDAVLVVNTEGRIVYCNENATKIFAYNLDEMLSCTIEDLMPKRFRKDHKAFHSVYYSVPKGRPMGDGKELFALRKDGSEFPTEIMLEPIEINNNLFILTIVRDITERKRAEQEIISQKNRFAQLFENSPIAISLLDDQDRVVFINESFSALFGYYQEEIRGKSLTDLIVPPELKDEAVNYSNATKSGHQINKESYRKKKDGSNIFVQVIGVPIVINDKTIGIYGMYVDLTQRKDAEDKMKSAKELAEQSDRLKTEFLAQMSHEIRTPINIMAGNVDYLKDLFSEKMDADARDCFEGIDLASKRIIRTIDLTLNVAELQTSGYNPQFVKVDLNSEILRKLYQEHQLSAKQKGLELIYKCELKETKILADEYSVTQIFANLVDNAIKYTKKGKVEILLDKNISGNIMVEIKDTGIGMSKKFLPKIFELFVQEEQGYTRSFDGNGLGLALVKNYCGINNAVIEVESEKNVGTTFRVTFSRE